VRIERRRQGAHGGSLDGTLRSEVGALPVALWLGRTRTRFALVLAGPTASGASPSGTCRTARARFFAKRRPPRRVCSMTWCGGNASAFVFACNRKAEALPPHSKSQTSWPVCTRPRIASTRQDPR
jgi:hypothetical protein